jgi:hypothetical protein
MGLCWGACTFVLLWFCFARLSPVRTVHFAGGYFSLWDVPTLSTWRIDLETHYFAWILHSFAVRSVIGFHLKWEEPSILGLNWYPIVLGSPVTLVISLFHFGSILVCQLGSVPFSNCHFAQEEDSSSWRWVTWSLLITSRSLRTEPLLHPIR